MGNVISSCWRVVLLNKTNLTHRGQREDLYLPQIPLRGDSTAGSKCSITQCCFFLRKRRFQFCTDSHQSCLLILPFLPYSHLICFHTNDIETVGFQEGRTENTFQLFPQLFFFLNLSSLSSQKLSLKSQLLCRNVLLGCFF